ncbi:hypothetical protein GGX14DRAFT_410269 [Mycena pura]|uniref:Uncharacterized protein n=1 Tax=Mycena pura TaxID=153505 RepID=A0AAD6YV66_9AGAR|nr:hypothetical protein GGX14DRAFT_410269 [Mycena pura]
MRTTLAPLLSGRYTILVAFLSAAVLCAFLIQDDRIRFTREDSWPRRAEGEAGSRPDAVADPLHPSASVYGSPTPSYKGSCQTPSPISRLIPVSDNLRPDTKYITSWGGNAGWTIMKLVYLGLLTDRVSVLPLHTSTHLPGEGPPLMVSEVFDLPRLRMALGKPVLEWQDVKQANSSVLDDIGCWDVWSTVGGDKGPRPSSVTQKLNLDISYTKTPFWIKLYPDQKHDLHSTFWSLAALDSPTARAESLVGTQALPSPQHQLSLPPDEQLLCYDYLYYAVSSQPPEIGSEYSPVWRDVGQHMHWTPRLERLADEYVRQALGIDTEDPIPPYISVHARHSDFEAFCPPHLPPHECFASLPTLARRVDEVKAEILERKGVEVAHVLVTSDERNQTWWDRVVEMGWRPADHARFNTEEVHGVWYPVLLDSVILSRGIGLVGTDGSTLSILASRRVQTWNDGSVRFVQRRNGMEAN